MAAENLHLTVETSSLAKRMAFKMSMTIGNASAHLRVRREMCDEIIAVFMPAHTAYVLQPVGPEGILTSNPYSLNKPHKATVICLIHLDQINRRSGRSQPPCLAKLFMAHEMRAIW